MPVLLSLKRRGDHHTVIAETEGKQGRDAVVLRPSYR